VTKLRLSYKRLQERKKGFSLNGLFIFILFDFDAGLAGGTTAVATAIITTTTRRPWASGMEYFLPINFLLFQGKLDVWILFYLLYSWKQVVFCSATMPNWPSRGPPSNPTYTPSRLSNCPPSTPSSTPNRTSRDPPSIPSSTPSWPSRILLLVLHLLLADHQTALLLLLVEHQEVLLLVPYLLPADYQRSSF
jgi:hypothetical protein